MRVDLDETAASLSTIETTTWRICCHIIGDKSICRASIGDVSHIEPDTIAAKTVTCHIGIFIACCNSATHTTRSELEFAKIVSIEREIHSPTIVSRPHICVYSGILQCHTHRHREIIRIVLRVYPLLKRYINRTVCHDEVLNSRTVIHAAEVVEHGSVRTVTQLKSIIIPPG